MGTTPTTRRRANFYRKKPKTPEPKEAELPPLIQPSRKDWAPWHKKASLHTLASPTLKNNHLSAGVMAGLSGGTNKSSTAIPATPAIKRKEREFEQSPLSPLSKKAKTMGKFTDYEDIGAKKDNFTTPKAKDMEVKNNDSMSRMDPPSMAVKNTAALNSALKKALKESQVAACNGNDNEKVQTPSRQVEASSPRSSSPVKDAGDHYSLDEAYDSESEECYSASEYDGEANEGIEIRDTPFSPPGSPDPEEENDYFPPVDLELEAFYEAQARHDRAAALSASVIPRKSLHSNVATKVPSNLVPEIRQSLTERIAAANQLPIKNSIAQGGGLLSLPPIHPSRITPLGPPKIATTAIISVAQAKDLVLDVPKHLTKYLDTVLDAFPGNRGVMLDSLSREVADVLRRMKGAVEEMGMDLIAAYENNWNMIPLSTESNPPFSPTAA